MRNKVHAIVHTTDTATVIDLSEDLGAMFVHSVGGFFVSGDTGVGA